MVLIAPEGSTAAQVVRRALSPVLPAIALPAAVAQLAGWGPDGLFR
ncbi:hypothetical protein NHF46_11480 [Arthrobacter alpinus]|nr:hypothetical protein [Arthrobacter alpinus]